MIGIDFNYLVDKAQNSFIQTKVIATLQQFLPEIIEKSGVRNIEEIFNFLIESSYEILPLPVRLLIKKEVYIEVVTNNKIKVLGLIKEIV